MTRDEWRELQRRASAFAEEVLLTAQLRHSLPTEDALARAYGLASEVRRTITECMYREHPRPSGTLPAVATETLDDVATAVESDQTNLPECETDE